MSPEWIALLLVSIAAVLAVYWSLKFRAVLPLEAALARERGATEERSSFAHELIRAHPLPATPQALAEAVQFGTDSFLMRFGGLHLFVWTRMTKIGIFPESPGELMCRTGALETLESSDLGVPDALWERVFASPAHGIWNGGLPAEPGRALEARGLRSMRLVPWGTKGRVWGLLGAVDAEPGGGAIKKHREVLEVLAAYFESVADRAGRLWEVEGAREQLEGGLRTTMQRLDETNLQLIQRAKEIKTIHQVSDAISGSGQKPDTLGAIVTILAKTLEADLCAFLLLDEAAQELVVQPGAYGISGDEGSLYRIALSNDAASSVRVFRTGKPFMTGDAQSDPGVLGGMAKLWKCHSLIVVPLRGERGTIGVMRIGSYQKDFFNDDHLKFVRVIAEEAAVLVESAFLSRELEEKNRQLTQLHRLKDDFVSTVSHEFKTPLTSIQGFLSVILEEEAGPLNAEQKRFLKITKSASERLGALVSDLLDISKLEGGLKLDLAPVELGDLVEKAMEGHHPQADTRGVTLYFEKEPGLPRVKGNEAWLRQVFDNLVSNAIKFTPEGGSIRVRVSNKGEGLSVAVSDSGIGIPERDRARIFEKFFRASNRGVTNAPGTGLGLAICKQIVDKHEGRLWFESEEGKGTTFSFLVPILREEEKVH